MLKKMNFCCSFSPAFSEHFLVLFQCNYEQSPDPEAGAAFLWYCCQRERRIHRPQAVGLQRYGRTVVPFPCQSFWLRKVYLSFLSLSGLFACREILCAILLPTRLVSIIVQLSLCISGRLLCNGISNSLGRYTRSFRKLRSVELLVSLFCTCIDYVMRTQQSCGGNSIFYLNSLYFNTAYKSTSAGKCRILLIFIFVNYYSIKLHDLEVAI